ncbi:MAG: hypothetical protein AAF388_01905 [Bacteroidota bacterium]
MLTSQEIIFINEFKGRIQRAIQNEIEDMSEQIHPFGWMPLRLEERMAEAAMQVLLTGMDLNKFLQKEGLIK